MAYRMLNIGGKWLINGVQLLPSEEIAYYPEREILPYDRFSTSQSIIQSRIGLLNSSKENLKVIITSGLNLLEKLPAKEFFTALQTFSLGETIALDKFKKILIPPKINVFRIIKPSIIDKKTFLNIPLSYFIIYHNPIRIEFFDEEIESIRTFNPSTQLTLNKITKFNLTTGSNLPLDDLGLKLFRDSWRDYFPENDERFCDLFNDLNNKVLCEGYEIYLPLFFDSTESFEDLFSDYRFITANGVIEENLLYWHEINRRFDEENIDASRPLLKPKDLFFNIDIVNNFIDKSELLDVDNSAYKELDYELGFEENLKLANLLLNEGTVEKIVVSSLIPSEYEAIKNVYLSSINEIENIDKLKNSINLINKNIFRPLYDLNLKTIYLHREFFENETPINRDDNSPVNIRIDTSIHFSFNDYVIHESYGLGVYKGLEIVESKGVKNEYLKISYSNNENLYVVINENGAIPPISYAASLTQHLTHYQIINGLKRNSVLKKEHMIMLQKF